MSRRCELTDTGVQTGFNVSHSNRHTKRRFLPNLQRVSVKSEKLRRTFTLRITPATLRSIDHNDGLDGFLLNTTASKLSAFARKLRRQIKKAESVSPAKPAAPKKSKAAKKASPKATKAKAKKASGTTAPKKTPRPKKKAAAKTGKKAKKK